MTDKLDLDAIEAREKAATPGEWRVSNSGFSVKSNDDSMPIVAQNPWGVNMRESQVEAWLRNGEFIAAARTDVPALVAEVRRLRAAIEHASLALSRIRPHIKMPPAQWDELEEAHNLLCRALGALEKAEAEP